MRAGIDGPALRKRLLEMPKAEIHVHLEGAIPRSAGKDVTFRSLHAFTHEFLQTARMLTSAADYADAVERFGEAQAKQNILYTEAHVAVSLIGPAVDRSELIDALLDSAAAVLERHGVTLKFIAGLSRARPGQQDDALRFALAAFERGAIIGIGLGGAEAGNPPHPFERTFWAARQAGLRVVAHAGEAFGAGSIYGALDRLGAERIGHGIRSVDDPVLLARLADEQIPLEVCPLSNYRVGAVPPNAPHPIRRLLDAGVRCTVNSDDPGMFGTTLVDDYMLLAEQGFTWKELWALNRATIDAAFTSPEERASLQGRCDAFEREIGVDR